MLGSPPKCVCVPQLSYPFYDALYFLASILYQQYQQPLGDVLEMQHLGHWILWIWHSGQKAVKNIWIPQVILIHLMSLPQAHSQLSPFTKENHDPLVNYHQPESPSHRPNIYLLALDRTPQTVQPSIHPLGTYTTRELGTDFMFSQAHNSYETINYDLNFISITCKDDKTLKDNQVPESGKSQTWLTKKHG